MWAYELPNLEAEATISTHAKKLLARLLHAYWAVDREGEIKNSFIHFAARRPRRTGKVCAKDDAACTLHTTMILHVRYALAE